MKIRSATSQDIPEMLKLINELALYEKEPNAVKTTAEDLQRDGFGENPYFQCLLGEIDGQVQGIGLYFFNWSTWEGRPSLFLEDLYVREASRGLGLGLALLKKLAQIAVEKKCKRFEWMVLDWNAPAIDFYHKIGAHHKKDWLPYRLDGEKLISFSQS